MRLDYGSTLTAITVAAITHSLTLISTISTHAHNTQHTPHTQHTQHTPHTQHTCPHAVFLVLAHSLTQSLSVGVEVRGSTEEQLRGRK